MTKKHFEAAAAIVRDIRTAPRILDKSRLAAERDAITAESAYIELFSQFNPRFDAERFRAACQPK